MKSYMLPLCLYAKKWITSLFAFGTFFLLLNVFANTTYAQATITTDKDDYPPGATVLISGTGWLPGETVTLQVLHVGDGDDGSSPSGAHLPFTTTANGQGDIASSWLVPLDEDELGATLLLTADGVSSQKHAEWTFTDRVFQNLVVDNQIGTASYGTAASVSFLVIVNTQANGSFNGITFPSISGLPAGTSYSFNPSSINAGNQNQSPSTTLTITTNNNNIITPAGVYTFIITASQTQGQTTTTTTGSGILTIGKANQTITWSNPPDIVYGTTLTGVQLNAAVSGIAGVPTGALTYTPAAGTLLNAGNNQLLHVDVAATSNYNAASKDVFINVQKADANVSVSGYNDVYDAQPHGATGIATGVGGVDLSSGLNLGATFTDVPGGTANWSFAGGTNYKDQSGTANIVISKRPASVTPNIASKYCGMPDPSVFTGTLINFISSDNVTATYSRTNGNTAGTYIISAVLSPVGVLGNYNVTYNTANFTILPINSVDASASANSYASGSSVILSATITPAVAGIPVTFTLVPGVGATVTYIATTDGNGLATKTVTGLTVNLYKVKAVAGSECAVSPDAYLTIYDPNAGFVTGGGWFISPIVSGLRYMQVSGKANFGFNAQYKKGSQTAVEGNTEFQFQAGNLNFKSSSYTATSLVIAGGKAIYKGNGTINGTGNYQFMVSAIDGSINGGSDRFRIKIWDANGVVYDNNNGIAENGDPATELGGGSIVIHLNKSGKAATSENIPLVVSNTFDVSAYPTLTNSYFTLKVTSDNQEKIVARITDIGGKTIETLRLIANQNEYFGHGYKSGLYLVEVIQGNNRKMIKVIKQ